MTAETRDLVETRIENVSYALLYIFNKLSCRQTKFSDHS